MTEKRNKHGNLLCSACGSANMKMHVGFDGLDCDSVAGDGSGFDYGVDMVCEDCGRAYPICRVKGFNDVSEVIERK